MTPSELDQLADYAEGLLDGTPDGDAVAARIATDQEWADAYRQLTAVLPGLSADLAALPEIPMPAGVAAALDAALAAQKPITVADDNTDDGPAGSDGGSAGSDELARARARAARRRRVGNRWAVAAAAVGLIGALGVGIGQLASQSGGDDMAESSSAKDSGPEVLSVPAAPPDARVSGTAYTTAGLAQQGRRLLTVSAAAPSSSDEAGATRVPAALQRLTNPTDLRGCLTALGVNAEPLAIDLATLDGTPAIVVVVQGVDASRITVVAAGTDCGVDGNGYERARVSFTR